MQTLTNPCSLSLSQGMETLRRTYGSLDRIKIITLAPEKVPDAGVIRELVNAGITVSLGHSMASLSDGERAVRHGATLITHLFNAMLPFHHRDPGLVGLLASDAIPQGQTVYFGIIADGVHTHPAALRIAYRTHSQGLILVTDAISALGLQDGVHHIGQLPLEVKQGKAFIAGTETLCGSIAPMDECVRIFQRATGKGIPPPPLLLYPSLYTGYSPLQTVLVCLPSRRPHCIRPSAWASNGRRELWTLIPMPISYCWTINCSSCPPGLGASVCIARPTDVTSLPPSRSLSATAAAVSLTLIKNGCFALRFVFVCFIFASLFCCSLCILFLINGLSDVTLQSVLFFLYIFNH